jgi:hypothetical protein
MTLAQYRPRSCTKMAKCFNIVLQALPINGKIVLHPHFAGSKPAKQNQD